jgi:hypothetical protein
MADLSPAAQAVYDAVSEICPAPADEIAAVTLRAVADLAGEELEFYNWKMINVSDLLAIAAELEAQ